MPAYLNSMSNLILRSKLPADKDPHKYGKVEQVGNKKKNSKVHNFIRLVIKSYCCLLHFYNILVNLEKVFCWCCPLFMQTPDTSWILCKKSCEI